MKLGAIQEIEELACSPQDLLSKEKATNLEKRV
jgi:hypothetical protein